jgi:hypothetical protein
LRIYRIFFRVILYLILILRTIIFLSQKELLYIPYKLIWNGKTLATNIKEQGVFSAITSWNPYDYNGKFMIIFSHIDINSITDETVNQFILDWLSFSCIGNPFIENTTILIIIGLLYVIRKNRDNK